MGCENGKLLFRDPQEGITSILIIFMVLCLSCQVGEGYHWLLSSEMFLHEEACLSRVLCLDSARRFNGKVNPKIYLSGYCKPMRFFPSTNMEFGHDGLNLFRSYRCESSVVLSISSSALKSLNFLDTSNAG
jgi:hypothetical protein